MHAATLGRELSVKRVVIPRHAGLFSAWGMLAARPRLDLSQTHFSALKADAPAVAAKIFADLELQATRYFGDDGSELLYDRKVEMRYAGQEHTVAAIFRPSMTTAADMLEAFHAAHELAYTFRLPNSGVEMVTFRLGAELDTPRVDLPEIKVDTTMDDALIGWRELHLGNGEAAKRAPVYDRALLPSGTEIAGPALIEEPTATALVLPGQTARIDRIGLMAIEATA